MSRFCTIFYIKNAFNHFFHNLIVKNIKYIIKYDLINNFLKNEEPKDDKTDNFLKNDFEIKRINKIIL